MSATRISQRLTSFALAAVMTIGVLIGLSGLADVEVANAQQLASAIASPRV